MKCQVRNDQLLLVKIPSLVAHPANHLLYTNNPNYSNNTSKFSKTVLIEWSIYRSLIGQINKFVNIGTNQIKKLMKLFWEINGLFIVLLIAG